MKVLKYLILLILLVLIGGGLYIYVTNRDFTVTQQISVKAPRELVFNQVKDFSKWKEWVSYEQKDLNLSFSDKKDTKDAYLTWAVKSESKEGKLQHLEITHYSKVEQEAENKNGLKETGYTLNWEFKKINDSTEVFLTIEGKPKFFTKINIILGRDSTRTFLNKMAERSLVNLRDFVYKKMEAYSVNIEGIRQSSHQTYIYTSQASPNTPSVIEKKRALATTRLKDSLEGIGISTTGPALMIYNSIDKEHHNLIVSFGFPIHPDIDFENLGENFMVGTLEEHRYLKGILRGNYTHIPKLWEKARVYMRQNHLEENTTHKAYEVYKVTAKDSKNPADWVTELYIPIQNEPSTGHYQ